MRIKLLKSLASVYGSLNVGSIVDIPDEALARKWCDANVAVEVKDAPTTVARRIVRNNAPREKPANIPEGHFWCGNCSVVHRETSGVGKRHLKHRVE